MNILNTTVLTAIKRPFIIIFFALLMLALALLNSINPLIPLVTGLINITGSGLFESIVSAMQIVLDPGFIPGFLLFLIGVALVASLLSGAVFSGFFHVMHRTLSGYEKRAGEFRKGIKKFFLRIFLMTLRSFLIAEFLVVFLLVASIPAAVVTRAAFTDKPDLMLVAAFVDLLTVLVLFFGLAFSRAYIFFWYPAAIEGQKKPFTEGRKQADLKFWGIAGRLLVFDAIFVIFQVFIYLLGNVAAQFIVGWLFDTLFFLCLITFVFSYYKADISKNEEK